MRHILIGTVALISCAICGAAHSQDYSTSQYCDPWCIEFAPGSFECSYHSLQQCNVSVRGTRGFCMPNPFLSSCSRPSSLQTAHKPRRLRHH
jgi:hypothetical protein